MHLRYIECPDSPEKYRIYRVQADLSNSTHPDSPIEAFWWKELKRQETRENGKEWKDKDDTPVYLAVTQYELGEFMIVDFPSRRSSYSYRSVRGVSQWCFSVMGDIDAFGEPGQLPDIDGYKHQFFAGGLAPVENWRIRFLDTVLPFHGLLQVCLEPMSIWDKIKAAAVPRALPRKLPLGLVELSSCDVSLPTQDHHHYMLKICVEVDNYTHAVTNYTKHLVCGKVLLKEVFELLCGTNLVKPFFYLMYQPPGGVCETIIYAAAVASGQRVCDTSWPFGREDVHLVPFPNTIPVDVQDARDLNTHSAEPSKSAEMVGEEEVGIESPLVEGGQIGISEPSITWPWGLTSAAHGATVENSDDEWEGELQPTSPEEMDWI